MSGYDECPQCGASFKAGRLACPECGSDARTGWKSSEEVDYESIEIPDYLDESALTQHRPSRRWLVVALAALAAFVIWAVLAR